MKTMRSLAALISVSLLASPVAAQQKPCVTPLEAETLALVAMPAIIVETRRICRNTLPQTAFLRSGADPLTAKYQAEADRAWPAARKALAKFVDPSLSILLESDLARPMFTTLLLSQMVGRIDTQDCATIDRMAALLQPLPPKNTAGLIVTTLQYMKAQKAKKSATIKDAPDLPICEARP